MADIPHYLNPPTDWWYKDFRFIRDWFWSMENCLPDRPLPDSINFVEEDLFPNRLKNIYEIVPDSLTTEYGPDREYFMYSLWGRKYDVFRPFDPHQRLGDWVLCKVPFRLPAQLPASTSRTKCS
ncbi:unnamed protein product [Cuscuta epithymum]|uniref:Pheophorbide a oxygenase domain-containing protein n=1 Tax=Cuscuta epithymum TaxID=186058 RepID=A0AAV0BUF5_9ASTE|nr:unnamed protein product [Cuscuta epithymum]